MFPSAHDLYYFQEVCTCLNLSKAAEFLGISQPSLSIAIKRLEDNIGTPLFVRNKKGVLPTEPGKILLSHVQQMVQLWESIKGESLASVNEIQGKYKLGCHPSVAQHVLPRLLKKIFLEYPRLELSLHHDLSRKVMIELLEDIIDLAIIVNPVPHEGLILKKLYADTVGFWSSNNMPAYTKEDEITIIADTNLLQTQNLLKKLEKEQKFKVLSSSNLDVIARITASGCGIGILPQTVVSSHFELNLNPVPNTPNYFDEIYLAYKPEKRQIKAIQVLTGAIRDCFEN